MYHLDKADKTKQTETGENDKLRYVAVAMQGWRDDMEDAHVHKLDLPGGESLFIVFDGHGGKWLIFRAFGFTRRQGSRYIRGKSLCRPFLNE